MNTAATSTAATTPPTISASIVVLKLPDPPAEAVSVAMVPSSLSPLFDDADDVEVDGELVNDSVIPLPEDEASSVPLESDTVEDAPDASSDLDELEESEDVDAEPESVSDASSDAVTVGMAFGTGVDVCRYGDNVNLVVVFLVVDGVEVVAGAEVVDPSVLSSSLSPATLSSVLALSSVVGVGVVAVASSDPLSSPDAGGAVVGVGVDSESSLPLACEEADDDGEGAAVVTVGVRVVDVAPLPSLLSDADEMSLLASGAPATKKSPAITTHAAHATSSARRRRGRRPFAVTMFTSVSLAL